MKTTIFEQFLVPKSKMIKKFAKKNNLKILKIKLAKVSKKDFVGTASFKEN